MDKVLQEIPKEHQLHHVDAVMDKSKPVIDPEVHVKTWDKEGMLKGIEAGVALKHVDTIDKSKPVIDPDVHLQPNQHRELMQEVRAAAAHAALVREVHAVSDAAGAGDGDEDVSASPIVAQLKHVETVDKGKPAIDPKTHLGTWDKEAFKKEVADGSSHLHHVDPSNIHDCSKPAIPADAHIGTNPAVAVLEQISSGQLPDLKHVEAPQ